MYSKTGVSALDADTSPRTQHLISASTFLPHIRALRMPARSTRIRVRGACGTRSQARTGGGQGRGRDGEGGRRKGWKGWTPRSHRSGPQPCLRHRHSRPHPHLAHTTKSGRDPASSVARSTGRDARAASAFRSCLGLTSILVFAVLIPAYVSVLARIRAVVSPTWCQEWTGCRGAAVRYEKGGQGCHVVRMADGGARRLGGTGRAGKQRRAALHTHIGTYTHVLVHVHLPAPTCIIPRRPRCQEWTAVGHAAYASQRSRRKGSNCAAAGYAACWALPLTRLLDVSCASYAVPSRRHRVRRRAPRRVRALPRTAVTDGVEGT
ncbi:hypothetical protein C8R47DRAFT_216187 [Mycena vitilis]|nr:hypothetical protein C8R47DRAFT_216187 [Mycena vitilis]